MALNALALDNAGQNTPLPGYPGPGSGTGASGTTGATPVSTASAPGPAGPPAAAPTTVTTDAGYTPDVAALIKADPTYQAWDQASQQQEAAARAQRQQALRSAVIQYGGMPAGFTDQYGDIDQATLDAAKANQQSTLANLHANYDQSVRQFLGQLAARGGLQSGELNFGQDQLNRGLAQQEYDAANGFGNSAVGAENAYTGVLGSIAGGRPAAVMGAEQNVASNPAYAPVKAKTANYDPAASAAYGRPVYNDGNGNYFGIDGAALGSGAGMLDWFTGQRKGAEAA